jgi:hypothetical protein
MVNKYDHRNKPSLLYSFKLVTSQEKYTDRLFSTANGKHLMKYITLPSLVILFSSCSTDCNRNDVIASYKKLFSDDRQLLLKLSSELENRYDSIETIEYYDYYYIVNIPDKGIVTRYEEDEFKSKYKDIAFICELMKNNSLTIIYNRKSGLQLESSCGRELHPRIILSNRNIEGIGDKTVEIINKDWVIVYN